MIKTYIQRISIVTLLLMSFGSCDIERLDSAQEVAEGGGTLTNFTAYTIEPTDPDGSNVFGRVVFWQTDLDQTLVQVSLYNTVPGLQHPVLILEGAVGTSTATDIDLATVSGETGELDANKFFLIADTTFYDTLPTLDAHISIFLSESDDTVVASGNLGANADPVETN